MITALCPIRFPDCCCACKICGRLNPPNPSAPMRRKFRRETPSQKRELLPGIVSIISGTSNGSSFDPSNVPPIQQFFTPPPIPSPPAIPPPTAQNNYPTPADMSLPQRPKSSLARPRRPLNTDRPAGPTTTASGSASETVAVPASDTQSRPPPPPKESALTFSSRQQLRRLFVSTPTNLILHQPDQRSARVRRV